MSALNNFAVSHLKMLFFTSVNYLSYFDKLVKFNHQNYFF